MMMSATAILLTPVVAWVVLRVPVLICPVLETVQTQPLLLQLGQLLLLGELPEQLAHANVWQISSANGKSANLWTKIFILYSDLLQMWQFADLRT